MDECYIDLYNNVMTKGVLNFEWPEELALQRKVSSRMTGIKFDNS